MGQTGTTMTASGEPKVIVATVTGKNQITIPAVVVRELQLEPGMRLEFELSRERSFVVRPQLSRGELARQVQGKWRHLLEPGEDPIADLIREREQDEEATA